MKYGDWFHYSVELTAIHKLHRHLLAYGFDPEYPGLCAGTVNEKPNPVDSYNVITSKRVRTVSEVIDVIHRAGGVAIMAHPFRPSRMRSAVRF